MRIEVVHGEPTAAELAAIVAVLRSVARRRDTEEVPAWRRAALREGLGARPAHEPADLRAGPRR